MITEYRLTPHVITEMLRRKIDEEQVAQVLASPEQIEPARVGRRVFQSRIQMGDPPRTYLLRVFVDVDRQPPDGVTVYRTSKIEKYWRPET